MFLYFRESVIGSIISDVFTFGMIFAGLLINRFLLGDKWYYGFFFILMALVTITGSRSKQRQDFHTKEELQDFVNNL